MDLFTHQNKKRRLEATDRPQEWHRTHGRHLGLKRPTTANHRELTEEESDRSQDDPDEYAQVCYRILNMGNKENQQSYKRADKIYERNIYPSRNRTSRGLVSCGKALVEKWLSIWWVPSDERSRRTFRYRYGFRYAPWFGRTLNDKQILRKSLENFAAGQWTWARMSWGNRHKSFPYCCLRWRRCSPRGSTDERN